MVASSLRGGMAASASVIATWAAALARAVSSTRRADSVASRVVRSSVSRASVQRV